MSNKTIPLDKVQLEIAKINLTPQLETLLDSFAEWCSDQQDDWEYEFYESMIGTSSGILYDFLTDNNIGIRPSDFEFYLIKKESDDTEESEQSNWSEVVGQK